MVRVMVSPLGTVVSGWNTRTGVTGLPETWVPRVMDVKAVIVDVMARALTPTDKPVSTLDDILKPHVTAI